jgi:division/cell wall cluster transcriptional repressor MraZ
VGFSGSRAFPGAFGVIVTGIVFQGGAGMLLDGKGRMTVPARHREGLKAVCEDRLTITKNPKRCLTIFPRPAWEAFRAKLLALPMSVDDWRRVYLGSAMDVEIDASSRVLIAPVGRSRARRAVHRHGFEVRALGQDPSRRARSHRAGRRPARRAARHRDVRAG